MEDKLFDLFVKIFTKSFIKEGQIKDKQITL